MAELAQEQFISYREGARLRELLNSPAGPRGSSRRSGQSNESERIRRLVARQMGVAILPRSDAEQPGAEVAVATLIEPSLRRDIARLPRGRRLAPAASEFLELSKELFSGGDGAD